MDISDAKSDVFPWENKVLFGVVNGKNYTYVQHDREYNFWPERPLGQQYVWYPITIHDDKRSYSVVAHNDPNLSWTKTFITHCRCKNFRSGILTGRSEVVEAGPPHWLNAINFPGLGGAGAAAATTAAAAAKEQ